MSETERGTPVPTTFMATHRRDEMERWNLHRAFGESDLRPRCTFTQMADPERVLPSVGMVLCHCAVNGPSERALNLLGLRSQKIMVLCGHQDCFHTSTRSRTYSVVAPIDAPPLDSFSEPCQCDCERCNDHGGCMCCPCDHERSEMRPLDGINDLVERVYTATAKDGREWFEDIGIDHYRDNKTGALTWYVSYRNSGDWKNNSEGPTLEAALTSWLEEYEDRYPIRYEDDA